MEYLDTRVEKLNIENDSFNAKEKVVLDEVIKMHEFYSKKLSEIKELDNLCVQEPALKSCINTEYAEIDRQLDKLSIRFRDILFENLTDGTTNTIFVEMKQGTICKKLNQGVGGDDASIFCSELATAYKQYAQFKNWELKVINVDSNDVDGYRSEAGVHRIIRVSPTKKSSVHTSTVCIAILPKFEQVMIEYIEI
ncbi:hypothetical protein MXB_4828 [Myxobolus squamalis]|nr:hypothetical protein MXB_4828 [Myxobolus squamalis]